MIKRVNEVDLGNNLFLVSNIYLSDPIYDINSEHVIKLSHIRLVTDTDTLLYVRGAPFERLTIYKEGDRWAVKVEATVELNHASNSTPTSR